MATKIKERKRKGEQNVFLYTELKKQVFKNALPYSTCCIFIVTRFLPSFCPDFVTVKVDWEERTQTKPVSQKKLDLASWILAWDAYALAAAALGQ
eukprot:9542324-Karenia_brevis.AAC.1